MMSCSNCRRMALLAVSVSALLVMQACDELEPPVNRLFEIAGEVPQSVADWVAHDPDQLFDTQSIYDYIDGHAEVYLAYSMRQTLARRYSGPESDIVLDIFEMASAGDAFGVFTYDLDGDEVGFGQGSRFRYGWLSFWKGPFFVSIYTDGEGPDVENAVLDLGRTVAKAITETGELPPLVSALPHQGLDRSSIRYLYHPQILSTHTSIPLDNPLGITGSSPVVLARYEISGRQARVLVVEYPSVPEAEAALRSAEVNFRGGEGGATGLSDSNTPSGARLTDQKLIIVLDADDQIIVEELLKSAQKENGP
jgi:hypothetical protein